MSTHRDDPESGPDLAPVQGDDHLRWVSERSPGGSDMDGFDAEGWPASTWILHAIYENPSLPGDVTYEDEARAVRKAARSSPRRPRWRPPWRRSLLERFERKGTAIGVAASESPGPDWQRARWRDLGARLGVDPLASRSPSFTAFPWRSWPANITMPEEGALDREQFDRLIDHLERCTIGGREAECVGFYARLATGDFDNDTLVQGTLGEMARVPEDDGRAPNNLWPIDRSWFVYSNYDLAGTKVSGEPSLIQRLEADPDLETASLRF